MKNYVYLIALILSLSAWATGTGYLEKKDQQYFKNDSLEGMNKIQRIDSNVKEINKLHGDIASLKSELAELRREVELLKASRK